MFPALRSLRLIVHLASGLLLALAVNLPGGRRLSRDRLGGWWYRRLLRILHLHVRVRGRCVEGPRLLVCNHVSWLDIPVLGAYQPTRFVSKAEVHDWPLVGWLADAYGTFYLKRGAGGTRELIDALSVHLRERGPVTLYPEGTTSEGDRLLRFRPRLFAAAIEAGCAVQPLALRYGRAADGGNIAPFVGEQTLVANLWRLLREPDLTVELIWCAPISVQNRDRSTLAQVTHGAIATALGVPAQASPDSLAA